MVQKIEKYNEASRSLDFVQNSKSLYLKGIVAFWFVLIIDDLGVLFADTEIRKDISK